MKIYIKMRTVMQLLFLPTCNSHHLFFGSDDITFINSIKRFLQMHFNASLLHGAAL